jgi:DNA-binding transcriptional LysR family regulator
MDFDQLETFLEVARLSSFSRAAEKRFRTQPAVSALIRALEEEVGARLLDRSGGKVALTAAGKVFQHFAEDAVDARRAIVLKLAEMERVPRGEIVVGANEATCLYILPEVFADYKKLYPSVGLTVSRAERTRTLDGIIEGSVDFGIVSMPVEDKRLTVVVIHKDELVVITPPGHPLTSQEEVTPAQIAVFPLLLPKSGRTRETIEKLFSDRSLTPTVAMELDSTEVLKRFVAAGVGLGFMPRTFVGQHEPVLPALRISGVTIRRDLALVFRKDKALSRAALAFIDVTVRLRNVPASAVRI